jgi:hypothetical protein
MNRPCSCGRVNREPKVVGLQRDFQDNPALVLWNCACGSTRAIPIRSCPTHLIEEAYRMERRQMQEAGAV